MYGVQDDGWYIQYISALYFSVTTMITVGYGDIHPWSPLEQLFGIFMMILASGVFGYTMNSIIALLDNELDDVKENRRKIEYLKKYCKQKGFNPNLQARINDYVEWFVDSQWRAKGYNNIVSNIYNKLLDKLHFNQPIPRGYEFHKCKYF